MNRYLMVCRLRWPAILLLTGVIALLNQTGVLSWWRAWPLYLILFGVLALAERAALASEELPPEGYPPAGYDGGGFGAQPGSYPASYPGAYPGSYAGSPAGAPASPAQPPSTGIVPVNTDLDLDRTGNASEREPRKSWE
jgi:hypothetical protein